MPEEICILVRRQPGLCLVSLRVHKRKTYKPIEIIVSESDWLGSAAGKIPDGALLGLNIGIKETACLPK